MSLVFTTGKFFDDEYENDDEYDCEVGNDSILFLLLDAIDHFGGVR